MKTKKEKLETLKAFLKENNIVFEENHYSNSFEVMINLVIRSFRIAVFISPGSYEEDTALIKKENKRGVPLYLVYNPFFIRDNETDKFIRDKMQNCILQKLAQMQSKWEKKQNKNS